MIIGFTGTRLGLSLSQEIVLRQLLSEHQGEFHHGGCVGADTDAHNIAGKLGFKIIVHPPTNTSKFTEKYEYEATFLPAKDYLERNQDIVDASDILFATPDSEYEKTRSGTWATIRNARKKGMKYYVITPTGKVML